MEKRRQPEIIVGRVNADGSIAAGDGFTVQKTGTGAYTVTLGSGFRLIFATTSGAAGAAIAASGTYTERSFTVTTFPVSGIATDLAFGFTAVGVQQ